MEYIGELSALAAALMWSFSSILFTSVVIKIGSVQLNFWRLIIAAILLGLTLYIVNMPINLTLNQILLLSFSGIIGLILGDTFLFLSFKEIGPRLSMLIMASNPAIAAIIAFFILDEKLSIIAIAGMFLTLSGIYIVIANKTEKIESKFKISGKGILFAFFGALGQSIGLILTKMAFNDGDLNGLVATETRIIAAIIIMLPPLLITGRFINPISLFGKDLKLFATLTLSSFIGPYLGINLSYVAIIYTKIGIAATLMALVPIIMLPLSVIVYKEKLSPASVIGTIITVAGVAILFLR